ncbi:hypothetical protein DESC_460160 [Desulfosarcina cetonica]|nr:hypothetical protein DESC_460160 [Desulfosarcina cetonica]
MQHESIGDVLFENAGNHQTQLIGSMYGNRLEYTFFNVKRQVRILCGSGFV